MTSFTLTTEQSAIVEFAASSDSNLIIQALAGAAKTSTLVLIAEALKSQMILCLSFNKKIAVEMEARLPGNCQSMTLNSLGHRAWGQALGKRLNLDIRKDYKILRGIVDGLTKAKQELAWREFADTLKAIATGKAAGYIPDRSFPQAKGLIGDDDFFAALIREPSSLQEELIIRATLESIEQAFHGTIDFADQLLMPTVFSASFPQYPLVMVDEAQDLSELNHRMLQKLAKGRLIAVGDSCQAIYAFRGAHEGSMELLKTMFDMHEMALTTSFRCPQAIVRAARWRAPAMQWPEWAREGEVVTWKGWRAEDVPEKAAIICRNNAPLFSMAIKLLKNGRAPKIVGNDFTKGIVKKLKGFGDTQMGSSELFLAIYAWRDKELLKSRKPKLIEDKTECFLIFADNSTTLGGAIAYAEHILSQAGPIQLMTGHKSKGLEFDNVIFLDEFLVGEEDQEPNLRYVIITRAKEKLTYAESENFVDGGGEVK